MYFTDGNHVRCIDQNGTIRTIAGNLHGVRSIAVDKKGNIFIGGYYCIRKIGTNGIITDIAGINSSSSNYYNWDYVKASDAYFRSVEDMDVDDNGNIVFVDNFYMVHLITQDGFITTLAGKAGEGYNGDNIPAKNASLFYPCAVAFGKNGEVFIADGDNYRIRKVMLPNANGLHSNEFRIPSKDATLQYIFDGNGKHLRTENTLTNAVMQQFKYNEQGTLDSIVDASGNATVIERSYDGTPTAIVGPYGHRSLLTLNNDGYLSSITNPAGEKIQMTYHDGSLLSSFTDAKGNSSTFEYDTLGRLIKDTDANGGFTSLQRVELDDGYEVRDSTAEGVVKVYKTRRLPDGTKIKEVQGCCGQSTISYTRPTGETEINSSDNTVSKSTVGPDPIFGMLSPLVKNYTVRLPSGIQMEMSSGKTVSYTSTNEIDSIMQLDTINGKVYKSVYAGATRTFSTLTPEGRTTESTIDSLGRVIHSVVSDLAPVSYKYDERGRIKTITEGSGSSARVWLYEYDNHGSLATVINPVGEQTTYTYDNAERIISKHFADMRQIRFGYDVNGNVQTITSPDNDAHTYYYNVVNLPTEYNPPTLNTGATPTTYSFNLDKDVASINRPDGLMLQFKYDDFGRLDSMVTPDGNYVYVYDPVTHKLVSSTTPDSNQLIFGYDGNITNSEISYGLLNDTISYSYNNNFQREARTIAGLSENYTYDNDGLMLSVGELNITRNPQNGLITGTTIGTISDALEYNTFGENTQYTVSDGLQNLFDVQYDRDKLGRITTKTEYKTRVQ